MNLRPNGRGGWCGFTLAATLSFFLVAQQPAAAQEEPPADATDSLNLAAENDSLKAQLAELQTENERLRAVAPRSDNTAALKAAQAKNDELRAALEQARRDLDAARNAPAPQVAERPADDAPIEIPRPPEHEGRTALLIALGIALTLAGGFWWGYRTLERRVRRKYGGLKVY